ncbi:hypothetical protein J7E96_13115 [Streptomyces sp. ISL-96]|uniref:hypothetical protein n=1 Tax=Streptomyces sp. ISL-96 TaxID=2819191 RepID=UPI001BEB97D1|nr:hypothetical protein [Streptomyces sp. ISL-96]MBT2489443.1 hypothetical protein [Streptomyces sp. ISL-96]
MLIKVANGCGCKLVSPWIAPGELIPIRLQNKDDPGLWWTVLGTTAPWNIDQRFTAHYTAANPVLAVFQNKLYCVHRGNDGDTNLWWASTSDCVNWSDDQQFRGHRTRL